MKTPFALFSGLVLGALLALSFTHATAVEPQPAWPPDPVAPLARALNALVDTLAETDPTFRERFLEKLEAATK